MKKLVVLTLFAIASVSVISAQVNKIPSFTNYPAAVERPKIKSVNFKMNPGAGDYRTRISDAMKRGVNFAGHYVLTGWGCGTGCINAAVIDTRTGSVHWPYELSGISTWYGNDEYYNEPVAFKKNSRLLIITGRPGDNDEKRPPTPAGSYYYQWKNNRFWLIKFFEKKAE